MSMRELLDCAGMIFRKEPFFYGHDNCDQLVKIAKVCSSCACSMAYKARRPLAFSHQGMTSSPTSMQHSEILVSKIAGKNAGWKQC